MDYNIILSQIWLDVVNPQINSKTNWFSICLDGGQVFELSLHDEWLEQSKIKDTNTENWQEISNNALSRHSKDTTHINQAPNIILVTRDEIFKIVNSQRLQTYIVEWQDLMEQDVLWKICQTIETLAVVDNARKQLIAKIKLPAEYENFVDVFNK